MKSGWLALICLVMLLVSPVTRGATAGPVGEQVGPWREQIHWVPMRDAVGVEHLLFTRVCRPQTEERARVVLINHGSPPDPSARASMRPQIARARPCMVSQPRFRRGVGHAARLWCDRRSLGGRLWPLLGPMATPRRGWKVHATSLPWLPMRRHCLSHVPTASLWSATPPAAGRPTLMTADLTRRLSRWSAWPAVVAATTKCRRTTTASRGN